jgi:hypothetical protein
MMHRWGHYRVSSALEVYMVLAHAPAGLSKYRAWEYVLGLEPPVWGSRDAAVRAAALEARGVLVWSWDDYAVVFSHAASTPPRGVVYRPWRDWPSELP